MSDFLFDLNIKNYSTEELRGMLDLKIPYSEQEISEQTNGLKNKLLNVADLSETKKENIMSFLVQTKNLLTQDLQDEFEYLKKTNIQSKNSSNFVEKSIQPGLINPIERNIIQSVINFDTRFDTSVSTNITCVDSEFTFNFPVTFENVVSIKVHSLELPNFLYNISSHYNNNTFDISGGGVLNGIIIDDGKYTKSELAAAITTKLGLGFTCTIDEKTGKTKFSNSSNFDIKFKPISGAINLGYILGFRQISITSKVVGSVNEVESINSADIDFHKYFYLSVDDFKQSADNNIFAFVNNFVSKNILAKARSKDDGNKHLFLKRNYFGPITLEKIKFSLLDHFGKVMDLNGIDYSFSIVIERLYKF
tara:strand:- start:4214 stop:5305 length:1092 start_codon:yes stop_codon:yes gene_type:complete